MSFPQKQFNDNQLRRNIRMKKSIIILMIIMFSAIQATAIEYEPFNFLKEAMEAWKEGELPQLNIILEKYSEIQQPEVTLFRCGCLLNNTIENERQCYNNDFPLSIKKCKQLREYNNLTGCYPLYIIESNNVIYKFIQKHPRYNPEKTLLDQWNSGPDYIKTIKSGIENIGFQDAYTLMFLRKSYLPKVAEIGDKIIEYLINNEIKISEIIPRGIEDSNIDNYISNVDFGDKKELADILLKYNDPEIYEYENNLFVEFVMQSSGIVRLSIIGSNNPKIIAKLKNSKLHPRDLHKWPSVMSINDRWFILSTAVCTKDGEIKK